MSRDDTLLGSDEDEEDGDDEEEAEKEAGAERDEGTGGEEDQMVVDVESGPAEAQEGSVGPNAKEQDSHEKGIEERSQAMEDKVILCEIEKNENDNHTGNEKEKVDKAVTDEPGQSEENNKAMTGGRDENSEVISANTNKDSNTETEGNTQGQSSTAESGKTNDQKLTQTEMEKCQTVRQADDRNNKLATAEEAELNSHAEPMEVEATETSTTDTSSAIRGEEDPNTGWILTLSHSQSSAVEHNV